MLQQSLSNLTTSSYTNPSSLLAFGLNFGSASNLSEGGAFIMHQIKWHDQDGNPISVDQTLAKINQDRLASLQQELFPNGKLPLNQKRKIKIGFQKPKHKSKSGLIKEEQDRLRQASGNKTILCSTNPFTPNDRTILLNTERKFSYSFKPNDFNQNILKIFYATGDGTRTFDSFTLTSESTESDFKEITSSYNLKSSNLKYSELNGYKFISMTVNEIENTEFIAYDGKIYVAVIYQGNILCNTSPDLNKAGFIRLKAEFQEFLNSQNKGSSIVNQASSSLISSSQSFRITSMASSTIARFNQSSSALSTGVKANDPVVTSKDSVLLTQVKPDITKSTSSTTQEAQVKPDNTKSTSSTTQEVQVKADITKPISSTAIVIQDKPENANSSRSSSSQTQDKKSDEFGYFGLLGIPILVMMHYAYKKFSKKEGNPEQSNPQNSPTAQDANQQSYVGNTTNMEVVCTCCSSLVFHNKSTSPNTTEAFDSQRSGQEFLARTTPDFDSRPEMVEVSGDIVSQSISHETSESMQLRSDSEFTDNEISKLFSIVKEMKTKLAIENEANYSNTKLTELLSKLFSIVENYQPGLQYTKMELSEVVNELQDKLNNNNDNNSLKLIKDEFNKLLDLISPNKTPSIRSHSLSLSRQIDHGLGI